MSAEHYPLRVGYLNMRILFSTLTASLMMRVITALGRFRSSGLSAISSTAQRRFEPGLTTLFTPQYGHWCGPWIRRSSAISGDIWDSPIWLKKLASARARATLPRATAATRDAPVDPSDRCNRSTGSIFPIHRLAWPLDESVWEGFPRRVQARAPPLSTLNSDLWGSDVTLRLRQAHCYIWKLVCHSFYISMGKKISL